MKIKYSGSFSGDEITDFCCHDMKWFCEDGHLRGDINFMEVSIYYFTDGVDGLEDFEQEYKINFCPFCGKEINLKGR